MIKKISRNRKFLIFSIQSGKLNSFFNRVIIYKLGIIFIIIIYRKNTIVIDKDNVPPDIEDAKSYIENYYNQKEIP